MAERRTKAAAGRELRRLRLEAPGGKLPQSAIATVAGVDAGTISRAERGRASDETYDLLFETMSRIHSGKVPAHTAAIATELRDSRERPVEDAFHTIMDIAIRNTVGPAVLSALAEARRAEPEQRDWTYWADQLAKALARSGSPVH
jgi:transcriptional regulator with XRE-family HTH domain